MVADSGRTWTVGVTGPAGICASGKATAWATTCALVPPKPKPLTAARRTGTEGQGPGSAGRWKGLFARSRRGLGRSTPSAGTSPSRSRTRILASPASPEAEWRWPMRRLREPRATEPARDPGTAEHLGEGARLDRVADGGAGAVRLDVLDGGGVDRLVDLAEEFHLGVQARGGDAHGGAVVVDGCRVDRAEDQVAVGEGGAQGLQYQGDGAFSGHVTVGPAVEGPAEAVR